ncbi:MAG: hypothetical protein ACKOTB_13860, partial [Planctomycetia bacterium]
MTTAEELPTPEIAPAPAEGAAARKIMEEAIARAAENGGPAPRAVDSEAPEPQGVAADDLLVARLSAEIAAKQLEARRTAQRSPTDAFSLLDEAAKKIADPAIPERVKIQLQQRIDRSRREIEESTG